LQVKTLLEKGPYPDPDPRTSLVWSICLLLNVPLKLASISYGITPWSQSRSVLAVAARRDLDSGASPVAVVVVDDAD